jgi:hypothetical protein
MAAEFDETLQKLLTGLMAQASAAGAGRPAWFTGAADVEESGPDKFGPNWSTASDDGLAADYAGTRTDGRKGEVVFSMLEHSLLSRLGRDLMMRHRTKARIWAHGMTRNRALGSPYGPIMVNTIEGLKAWMMAGER